MRNKKNYFSKVRLNKHQGQEEKLSLHTPPIWQQNGQGNLESRTNNYQPIKIEFC